MNQQIKIALVDDHTLFRRGLVKLIHGINEKRYFILFEADDGKDFISKLDKRALPDIVIMDIEMPNMDGFETVLWLRNHYPQVDVIVVSMIDSEDAVIRMLKLGVKGYLSKHIEPEDLSAALRAVASKNFHYTDFITGKLIHSVQSQAGSLISNQDQNTLSLGQLTEREREFIRHACTEATYDEIAAKMYVSPKTVDGYREAVFKKMNARNRVGLVIHAIKNKLVTL